MISAAAVSALLFDPASRYVDIARAIWEWPVADDRPRAAPR